MKKNHVRQAFGLIMLVLMIAIFLGIKYGFPESNSSTSSYSDRVFETISIAVFLLWLVAFAISKTLMILDKRNWCAWPAVTLWVLTILTLVSYATSMPAPATETLYTPIQNLMMTLFLFVIPLVDLYDALDS